jgi:UPF0755 protein
MSSHRPAEPHYSGRATGAVARSPSEALEPTRPLARSRRRRYGREPGQSSGLFRVASGIFTLLLLFMAIVGAAALLLNNWLNEPGPLAASKDVVIPKGDGVHEIAARLEREGVIADRRLFTVGYFVARATSWGDSRPLQLKAGSYRIPQAASIRDVMDIIGEGRTIAYRVTIPEGFTSHQIVDRLRADPNLSGEIAEVPPEGSLLPETFIVQRGAPRQSIVDNMRSEARKMMEKAWAQRQKGLPFRTWEEAVVLASIVEKETGRNDERERVAAVFVNRLRQNMRLQSDPTILYGIGAGKTIWNRPIMKSDIAQKTAHNTYQIDGLPPTPICNPGRAAIAAVLNPASTKDLYFVADGNGGHIFSETLKDHNASVQKWRTLEKENREKEDKEKERDSAEKDAKDGKAKTAAPGPAVQPAKAPDKGMSAAKAPDKGTPARKAPDKAGKAAPSQAPPVAAKPAPPPAAKPAKVQRQDGSWASTTEPAGTQILP